MLDPSHYTLLLTYNTYPNFEREKLISRYNEYYKSIKSHRTKILNTTNIDEYEPFYKPIHFHLWGAWDLLTIAFIDNNQLITKSIQTGFFDDGPVGFMHAKINTGIMFKDKGLGIEQYNSIIEAPLCANINLTISKKWLLPNGMKLMQFIVDKIIDKSQGTEILILNSFSSYEISVILFGQKLSTLGEVAQNIRELKFEEADKKQNFTPLNEGTHLIGSNIFSDSNTSFGVRYDYENKIVNTADIDVKMLIELEVRPSKNNEIIKLLEEQNFIVNTKPGKFDVIGFKSDFEFSNEIVAEIKTNNLSSHIRNFKTILLFKTNYKDENPTKNEILNNPMDFIKCGFNYKEINNNLKVLKVSKALRYQIVKLFFTYQNVLADPISYSYFLDLIYYVKNIEKYIKHKAEKTKINISLPFAKYETPLRIQGIEKDLKEFLEIFEETYFIRYVNDHLVDEVVPDFMVRQSGGQLQGICSAYDNVAKFMISSLYAKDYNQIVTSFDDTVIEIKNLHLKLSSSLLFEPATLLFILLKEALNQVLEYEIKNLNKVITKPSTYNYQKNIRLFLRENIDYNIYKYKSIIEKIEVEEYLLNDYLRLSVFFKDDFELFYYFHISSLLMNPSFYYASGPLRRGLLVRELYRLILVALIYRYRTGSSEFLELIRLNSPNIESQVDWLTAYNDLKVCFESEKFRIIIVSLSSKIDIYRMENGLTISHSLIIQLKIHSNQTLET